MKVLRVLDSVKPPLVLSQGALGARRFPSLGVSPHPFSPTHLHYR
jgi:hypothetical protein